MAFAFSELPLFNHLAAIIRPFLKLLLRYSEKTLESHMKRYLILLTFCFALVIGASCKTTGQEFLSFDQGQQDNSEESISAHKELNRLTNNGKTLPSYKQVNEVVSNPGDISFQRDCIEIEAASDPPIKTHETTISSKKVSPFKRNVASHGKAIPYGVSLKNHPRPERGCYPVENVSLEEAKAAIESQNFSFKKDNDSPGSKPPSDEEIRAFGAAILSMQYLNGGIFQIGRPEKKFPFVYCDDDRKSSRQFGNKIRISRKGRARHGLSVAQYVHEWGHLIGNSVEPSIGQGNNIYNEFLRAIGGKVWTEDSRTGRPGCLVSRYADNRSNEHFSELLTAFVTEPFLLREMGKTNKVCKKAYEFFEKVLFKKGERARECM